MPLRITNIERILLDIPFYEIPERNMGRDVAGWHISEVCRVETDAGLVGWGETLPNYTWGRVTDEAVARARGQAPEALMWDDSLGAGLQMALFDLAGKAAGVPAYRLLGHAVRERCPISWWSIDMPPEDMAAEAARAVAEGYTAHKQKARPWFDVLEQARRTAAAVPPDFALDFDFNGHLVDAARALPVLTRLDSFPNVQVYETPIPQGDVAGNRRLRAGTRCAIAMHYGSPPIMTALRDEVCDGFVVSGGATTVTRQAAVANAANLPFWLQLVGTGLTTTWALHLGAVCTHARWPAVTCLNMYQHQVIARPVQVRGGFAPVPGGPGLGVEVDEQALRVYRTERSQHAERPAIYGIHRANGQVTYYAGERVGTGRLPIGYWDDSAMGNMPVYEEGMRLETWYDDGTPEWRDLRKRVDEAPVAG